MSLMLCPFFSLFAPFLGARGGSDRGRRGEHFLEGHEVQVAVVVEVVGVAREEPKELRLWRREMSGVRW